MMSLSLLAGRTVVSYKSVYFLVVHKCWSFYLVFDGLFLYAYVRNLALLKTDRHTLILVPIEHFDLFYSLHAGKFCMLYRRLLFFFYKIRVFKKIFQRIQIRPRIVLSGLIWIQTD